MSELTGQPRRRVAGRHARKLFNPPPPPHPCWLALPVAAACTLILVRRGAGCSSVVCIACTAHVHCGRLSPPLCPLHSQPELRALVPTSSVVSTCVLCAPSLRALSQARSLTTAKPTDHSCDARAPWLMRRWWSQRSSSPRRRPRHSAADATCPPGIRSH